MASRADGQGGGMAEPRVLITGGPTRAYLDAVRFLSNEASGRLGALLAEAACARGWRVHYLRGKGSALPAAHPGLTVEEVETVGDLEAAVRREVGGRGYDAVIHTMAVLDFVPAETRAGKVASADAWTVRLVPSPKVIRLVRELDPHVYLVGFKLESGADEEALAAAGRAALERYGADLMVANALESVRSGEHAALLVTRGEEPLRVVGKEAIALAVLERVGEALVARSPRPPAAGEESAPVPAGMAGVRATPEAGPLAGRMVVVVVGAGIAAYKVAGVVRRLRRAGAVPRVAMTREAARLVGPATFEALSGHPVLWDLFAPGAALEHVRLADAADAALVAPATADLIGRLAAGLADDAATTLLLALGTRVPVLLAPAMNVHMWRNPLVQRNVEALRRLGYRLVGPEHGPLAEGYEGLGRLAGEETLLAALTDALGGSVPDPGPGRGARAL